MNGPRRVRRSLWSLDWLMIIVLLAQESNLYQLARLCFITLKVATVQYNYGPGGQQAGSVAAQGPGTVPGGDEQPHPAGGMAGSKRCRWVRSSNTPVRRVLRCRRTGQLVHTGTGAGTWVRCRQLTAVCFSPGRRCWPHRPCAPAWMSSSPRNSSSYRKAFAPESFPIRRAWPALPPNIQSSTLLTSCTSDPKLTWWRCSGRSTASVVQRHPAKAANSITIPARVSAPLACDPALLPPPPAQLPLTERSGDRDSPRQRVAGVRCI